MDAADLIARCRGGDRAAAEALVEAHAPALRAYVGRIAPSWDAAEDCAQEVFIRALRSLDSCHDPRAFQAWLRGIARHVVHDIWRRRAGPERASAWMELAESLAADDPVETGEAELAALAVCREALPAPLRELLRLRFERGRDCEEIATLMSRPAGSVRSALARTYDLLRRCIAARMV